MDRLIRHNSATTPDKPAVIEPETSLTHGELDSTTRRLAAVLVDAGVGKGTRVGVLLPNGTAWVQLAVALTRIGAVLVPLSTLLRPPELRAQLRVAAVRIVVTVAEFRGRRYLEDLPPGPDPAVPLSDPALPALRHVWTIDQLFARTPSAPARGIVDALAESVCAADPLVVLFTSGSRGMPKGVVHSHGSAFGAVRAGLAARCIDATTRLYLPMPFFWVGGLGGGVLSALVAGATLITEAIPQPETTLELLRRERVTLFRGWPDQAEALARRAAELDLPVPTLRPGSLEALLPPALRSKPGARANLFGMTESFGPYCGYPADTDLPDTAQGSCGRPFPGMEVRITDPGDGHPVPPGTVGVIELRGPHILRGICGRDDVLTRDGFYPTGDLGRLDTQGFLFYHGRSDDMFKVSGATVYPSEVERALRAVDGVDEAFVAEVAGSVGAVVVCDPATTPESLRAEVRESLSAFKIPTVWVLLDSPELVPRGGTGKADLPGLRALLAQGTHR
ncbi:class I adenylate-forming enzyme family protein [Nocardia sp. NPDC059177]|uniref:class I adenylate-forming enzyme family protein n=1 Tax=Nocardia sp. NPDC059177 TaxID=3346759 RepID=UPI0036A9D72A